jgi:hypothetical protein
MSGRGFPSQNPANQKPAVRPPVHGGLMAWMKWNFPTVYARVNRVPQDTRMDFKDGTYAKKHPNNSGRTQ